MDERTNGSGRPRDGPEGLHRGNTHVNRSPTPRRAFGGHWGALRGRNLSESLVAKLYGTATSLQGTRSCVTTRRTQLMRNSCTAHEHVMTPLVRSLAPQHATYYHPTSKQHVYGFDQCARHTSRDIKLRVSIGLFTVFVSSNCVCIFNANGKYSCACMQTRLELEINGSETRHGT